MKKKILLAALICGLTLLLAGCSGDFEYSSFNVESGEVPLSVYNEALKMKDDEDPFFQNSAIRDFLKNHPENKNNEPFKQPAIGISTLLKEKKVSPNKILEDLKIIQAGGDIIEFADDDNDERIKIWIYVEPVES